MKQDLQKLPDADLATEAARAHSLPAFEEIVRRYQVPLRHFLQKRFPSRSDNDDILQDAFLKAWQSIGLYNPKLPLRTWLYTITYRTAVSQGRKDKPAKPLSPGLSATGIPPHASLQQQDDRHNLWQRAREVLSDDQFTALWLHYVNDLPAQDIAKILNRSWVSVKTLMHRARRKLQPLLAESPHAPSSSPTPSTRSLSRARIPIPVPINAGEV
jgi:RNA polymerase sigma-70 factor (ECF subfamily)